MSWVRMHNLGNAIDRQIDENKVERLLNARTDAKTAKQWTKADEIAEELQTLDVCYVDERNEWYTRPISTAEDIETRELKKANKRKGKGQKRTSAVAAVPAVAAADEKATTTKQSFTTSSPSPQQHDEEQNVCCICLDELPTDTNKLTRAACCGKQWHAHCQHNVQNSTMPDELKNRCHQCRKPIPETD